MSQTFDYSKCKAAMEDNLPKSFRSQDNGQLSAAAGASFQSTLWKTREMECTVPRPICRYKQIHTYMYIQKMDTCKYVQTNACKQYTQKNIHRNRTKTNTHSEKHTCIHADVHSWNEKSLLRHDWVSICRGPTGTQVWSLIVAKDTNRIQSLPQILPL